MVVEIKRYALLIQVKSLTRIAGPIQLLKFKHGKLIIESKTKVFVNLIPDISDFGNCIIEFSGF